MGTPLDPISIQKEGKDILEYTSSRAIIIAVKPMEKVIKGTFPEVVKADQETDSRVRTKFQDILK
jgi:hypothetical protein